MLRVVASVGFILLSSSAFGAQSSSALLDQILLEALGEAAKANEQRVAEEIRTRDERKSQGDQFDIARKEEQHAREQLAEMAEAERERVRAEQEEAERREEMLAQAQYEAEREAAAARRAAESAAAQANANSIIMDAINRNAAAIASAQIQGQAAVNSAYATVAAINAQRRAEADAQAAAAVRNQAAADAARRQAEIARQQIEAAQEASRRAAQTAAQTSSSGSGLSGATSGVSSSQIADGTGASMLPDSGNRTIIISLGGGTSSAPLAPTAAQTMGTGASGETVLAATREPFSRHESLAYCYHKKEQNPGYGADAWYCDGPIQNTLTNNPLPEALSYVGCREADYEHRSVPFSKGVIFFCEKGIAPYDSDIAERYGLPSQILARRNTYLCKDVSATCTRENAISVASGRGW